MHRSDVYRFEKVAEGVWAAIPLAGSSAMSNSGIVDLGRACLVFDTSQTPRAAKDLRVAARILSGKEPLEVANSHWHFDHTLGNRVFGGCTIRSTRRTHDLLVARGSSIPAAVSDPSWSQGTAQLARRALEEQRPLERQELEEEAAARRDLSDARDLVNLRPPDEFFTDRFVYPGGNDVMLVEGAGHSESDSILFVPDSEVYFAGDLVTVGSHPSLGSSDVDRWLTALARMEESAPRKIVPGHGPVTTVDACRETAAYLRSVRALAQGPGTPEMPTEYASWARPSRFRANIESLRARLG
ncbi:MAG: MBL fold metallo-hydrolase [Candidatus Lutacidiplasmatales archaeon]